MPSVSLEGAEKFERTPAFYNDLHASFEEAWRLWGAAPSDRHSPLHTPVVATLTAQGQPSQRVMVLRAVERAQRCFRFHTDWRSTKVQAICGQNAQAPHCAPASLLGYDASRKIQLRLEGSVQILHEGPLVDAAWASTKLNSRRCYLAEQGSGTPSQTPTSGLSAHWEAHFPNAEESQAGRANFSIVLFYATTLEWHYLAHQGHRRALFTWQAGAEDPSTGTWQGVWLAP